MRQPVFLNMSLEIMPECSKQVNIIANNIYLYKISSTGAILTIFSLNSLHYIDFMHRLININNLKGHHKKEKL